MYIHRMRAAALVFTLITFACDHAPQDVASPQFSKTSDEYDVVDLGTFGGAMTQALSIDKHGVTYGRYGTALAQRSYRWTEKGGFEDLGGLDGQPFLVLNINDHGLLAGSIPADVGTRPAAYDPMLGFVYLDDPSFRGTARGSNEKGDVVGMRFPSGGGASESFLWNAADGFRVLQVELPASVGTVLSSGASDINDDGTIFGVLTYRPAPGSPLIGLQNRAFVWDAVNGTRLIPPLGPATLGTTHLSDDGVALGASEMRRPFPGEMRGNPLASTPGTIPVHAWKWTEAGGLIELTLLGGDHSVAWSMDKRGNIYGWASDAAGVQHAVKWTPDNEIVKLGTLGGHSVTGGVNKHGVVTGWSFTADGEMHAVHFVPRKK